MYIGKKKREKLEQSDPFLGSLLLKKKKKMEKKRNGQCERGVDP